MATKTPLLPIVKKYFERDPLDAAHTLETMSSEEAIQVLKNLPTPMVTEAFRHLNDAYAAILIQKLPASIFQKVANNLGDQQAANIFLQFSSNLRKQFLDLLDENKKRNKQETNKAKTPINRSQKHQPFFNSLKVNNQPKSSIMCQRPSLTISNNNNK